MQLKTYSLTLTQKPPKYKLYTSFLHDSEFLRKARREEDLPKVIAYLEEFGMGIANLLTKITDIKCEYSEKHHSRVGLYALALAQQLGLPLADQLIVYFAGILHDLGKAHIPDKYVMKPGRLEPAEYAIVKEHAPISFSILQELSIFRDQEARYAKYHHEHFDGWDGYFGLIGEEIPLLSRLISIADTYDAMTNRRIYKDKAATPEEAYAEIVSLAGKQFDPYLISAAFIPWFKQGRPEPDLKNISFYNRLKVYIEEYEQAHKINNPSAERKYLIRFMEKTYLELIKLIAKLIQESDLNIRGGDSLESGYWALKLARYLKQPWEKQRQIYVAALLRPLGEMFIRDDDLKPDSKNMYEYVNNKKVSYEHTRAIYGSTPFFKEFVPIIDDSHESYNGRAGVLGKQGQDILYEARILTVAFDYYNARGDLATLQEHQAEIYDPAIVSEFIKILS